MTEERKSKQEGWTGETITAMQRPSAQCITCAAQRRLNTIAMWKKEKLIVEVMSFHSVRGVWHLSPCRQRSSLLQCSKYLIQRQALFIINLFCSDKLDSADRSLSTDRDTHTHIQTHTNTLTHKHTQSCMQTQTDAHMQTNENGMVLMPVKPSSLVSCSNLRWAVWNLIIHKAVEWGD